MAATTNRHALGDAPKAVLKRWWHSISSENPSGSARADRAVLKRADNLLSVACTAAYQRVYRDMATAHANEPWRAYQQERIAAIVALAAHVKESTAYSLPKAISHPTEGSDRNPVSELRFARLLDAPDIEALFTGLRRSLPLIGHAVDVLSLADDVYGWGDVVKKRWAYDYAWPKKSAD
jgi:CRISPR system Cascade subunit CasB